MSTDTPSKVTLDRVIAIMKEFEIELQSSQVKDTEFDVASANLNGYQVMFAVLDSALIVRADNPTEVVVAEGNPALHIACNQANCFSFAAKAVVVDRTEKAILRTEKEISIPAGLTNVQLSAMLKNAIDNVLALQETITAAVQEDPAQQQ